MAKQQRQWIVQRHFRPTPDGWHRWDRAYQLLMQWANEQQDHHPQEETDATSDVCASLDHAAGADADH